jgi:hypothetical protein
LSWIVSPKGAIKKFSNAQTDALMLERQKHAEYCAASESSLQIYSPIAHQKKLKVGNLKEHRAIACASNRAWVPARPGPDSRFTAASGPLEQIPQALEMA